MVPVILSCSFFLKHGLNWKFFNAYVSRASVSQCNKRRTQPFSVRYFRSRENARDEALGKKLAFCQI